MQEDKKIEEYVILNEQKENRKEKLGNFLGGRYFVPVVIVLIAVIAFCLGRVSGLQEKRAPVRVLNNAPLTNSGEVKGASINNSPPNPSLMLKEGSPEPSESGQVVASKNGTKYHYPWCAGAKQISQKNLVTFNSIESARTAGYTPASNCKGLK